MDRDWTASFSIRFWNGTCIIILDKKYNIANSSCHFGSYGSIWTGPSPKKYYLDLIWQYIDRSIYCHMTLSAMNYLLYRNISVFNGSVSDDIIIKYMKFCNLPTHYVLYLYMYRENIDNSVTYPHIMYSIYACIKKILTIL